MDMKQWTLHYIDVCSIISSQVLRVFFLKIESSYGYIHQPPKDHPQENIQSAVMSPYLFPA